MIQSNNNAPEQAIQAWIQSSLKLEKENAQSKAIKEQKKQSQQPFINFLKNTNRKSYNYQGIHIKLEEKLDLPRIDIEFVVECFKRFANIDTQGTPQIRAERFGAFIEKVRKEIGLKRDRKYSLKKVRCKPVSSIFDDL